MVAERPPAAGEYDWKAEMLGLRRELAKLRREKRVLFDLAELARLHLDHFTEQERRRFHDVLRQLDGSGHVVQCPHCHATRNFFVHDGGTMLRVLEDAKDTERLEEGRALVCENCGEVFLCPELPVAAKD